MKPIFSIDELELRNDSPEEQIRTRKIFEVLKAKAITGKEISESEKNFFCKMVKISHLDDGKWEDYSCCENVKFKFLYLTYYQKLAGGTTFYKPKGSEIVKVDIQEVEKDLKYLYEKSDEWELVIQKTNHSEQLLQQISKEIRQELKELDKQPEIKNQSISKGSFLYIFKRRKILLQSKYIYSIGLEILELLEPDDLILEINGQKIIFNEFSLIHILTRHFAKVTKQFDTKKTFHNEDFKPRILSIQLKEILGEIDATELLKEKAIDKIAFRLNNIDYIIYTSEELNGSIKYRRLNTFFPVSEQKDIDILQSDYTLTKINEDLSVYVSKL